MNDDEIADLLAAETVQMALSERDRAIVRGTVAGVTRMHAEEQARHLADEVRRWRVVAILAGVFLLCQALEVASTVLRLIR